MEEDHGQLKKQGKEKQKLQHNNGDQPTDAVVRSPNNDAERSEKVSSLCPLLVVNAIASSQH